MQKIGLFFGTFDPIHNGHLTLANHFANETNLDAVWLVITPQNPFKQNSKMLPNTERLELVSRAIKGHPKLEISTVEFELPKPNFTYETLSHLAKNNPKRKFVLLMGEDNIISFPQWKEYQSIIEKHEIYVYPRKNDGQIPDEFLNHPKITWTNAPLIDITSSQIRQWIKEGENVKSFLPSASWIYLDEKGFYR